MTKKLMFILLMSGVILSPLGIHAMIDEEGAPRTPTSKAAPSYIESLEMKIRQGQNESFKTHPGSVLPPAAFLSLEEADHYYDYQMLKEKIRQGHNEMFKAYRGTLFPLTFFLSEEEADRYYGYVEKK